MCPSSTLLSLRDTPSFHLSAVPAAWSQGLGRLCPGLRVGRRGQEGGTCLVPVPHRGPRSLICGLITAPSGLREATWCCSQWGWGREEAALAVTPGRSTGCLAGGQPSSWAGFTGSSTWWGGQSGMWGREKSVGEGEGQWGRVKVRVTRGVSTNAHFQLAECVERRRRRCGVGRVWSRPGEGGLGACRSSKCRGSPHPAPTLRASRLRRPCRDSVDRKLLGPGSWKQPRAARSSAVAA